MGDYEKALADASEAVGFNWPPTTRDYRITRQAFGTQREDRRRARRGEKKAVELSDARPHVKARALCVLGDLVIIGPNPNFRLAIERHAKALTQAKALVSSPHPAVRLAAKEVIVDADFGRPTTWRGALARSREGGRRVVEQASDAAADLVKNEGGDGQYRFRVATRALAAYVGLHGQLDPDSWTQETIHSGDALIAESVSAVRKSQLQWDVGMALYDSLQIYQARKDHTLALKYGELATQYMESSKKPDSSALSPHISWGACISAWGRSMPSATTTTAGRSRGSTRPCPCWSGLCPTRSSWPIWAGTAKRW